MARFGGPGNFGGMGDLQKLMKQAQKMQEETAKLQEALPAARYSANAGGGMVTITVNGYGQLVEVKINPAIVDPADVEILEDLIVTAAKEAAAKAQTEQESQLEEISGGLGDIPLPPGFLS